MARLALSIQDQNGDTPILVKNYEKKIRGAITNSYSFQFNLEGFNSFSCQLWNNSANPFIQFLTSNDGIYWTPLQVSSISGYINSSAGFRLSNNNPMTIIANKVGNYVKISQSGTTSFTSCNIIVGQSQFSNKENATQFSQDSVIRYVSASAITTNTPVTLAAANSPSFSNSLSSIQLYNAGTGESEILIKQGSNVIFRTFISTKQVSNINFSLPITDNSASAITAELVTSTNMLFYINAQGLIFSKNN